MPSLCKTDIHNGCNDRIPVLVERYTGAHHSCIRFPRQHPVNFRPDQFIRPGNSLVKNSLVYPATAVVWHFPHPAPQQILAVLQRPLQQIVIALKINRLSAAVNRKFRQRISPAFRHALTNLLAMFTNAPWLLVILDTSLASQLF